MKQTMFGHLDQARERLDRAHDAAGSRWRHARALRSRSSSSAGRIALQRSRVQIGSLSK